MSRVLVTGLGTVSAYGETVERFWEGVLAGVASIRELPMPEHYMPRRRYYPVPHSERHPAPEHLGDGPGRAQSFALDAARQALTDAGLCLDGARAGRVAVVLGTAMGRADHLERQLLRGVAPRADEAEFLDVATPVAAAIGACGEVVNVSTACAAGANAVAMGMDILRGGEADHVVAGGTEAASFVPPGCFNRLGAFDPVMCRPFAAERRGTMFGEGAAVMLLETEHALEQRGGARAYAEVRGYGLSCDGHHVTAPDATGTQIERAARDALARAGMTPNEVTIVLAHGTGTELNDAVESRIMERILGANGCAPWTVPVKANIGHGGGAAGAFACLLAALVLHHGRIPPYGLEDALDPGCPVRLNRGGPVEACIRGAMVNAYGFGGNNISVLLSNAWSAR